MIRFLLLSRFMWRIYAIFVLGYLLFTAWGLRGFVRPSVLFGNHALVIMNNAEARPCGGFITAVGEFRVLPPRVTAQNIYNLPQKSLGEPHPRLKAINTTKNLWDSGVNPRPLACMQDILNDLNTVTGKEYEKMWLVQLSAIESLVGILGEVTMKEKIVPSERFFASVTQQAADVDRHNIEALNTRKSFLRPLLKSMVWQTITQPHKWAKLTRALRTEFLQGNVIHSEITRSKNEDYLRGFGVLEWNTGGAKSSRYIHKSIKLNARETEPKNWEINVEIIAKHLGMYDEPLSQNWKGGMELHLPDFLESNSLFFALTLRPGETVSHSASFNYEGDLDEESLRLWRGIGQDLAYEIQITGYPQQFITSAGGHKSPPTIKENTIRWVGALEPLGQDFFWEMTEDIVPPFITLHEVINPKALPPILHQKFVKSDLMVVELHFNESVEIKNDFSAKIKRIIDENQVQKAYEAVEIAQIRERTMILGFPRDFAPAESAYSVSVSGLADAWGNEIAPAPRTVIDRVGIVEIEGEKGEN